MPFTIMCGKPFFKYTFQICIKFAGIRFNITKLRNGLASGRCYSAGNPMQVSGNILGVLWVLKI